MKLMGMKMKRAKTYGLFLWGVTPVAAFVVPFALLIPSGSIYRAYLIGFQILMLGLQIIGIFAYALRIRENLREGRLVFD